MKTSSIERLVISKTKYGFVESWTEWHCENCGWVTGKLINVTGYTDLVCEHCDKTLKEDYYDLQEYEQVNHDQTT